MITDEIRSELTEVGLDCTAMVEKFLDSEAMFLKYFRKFFESADAVVGELHQAVVQDDYSAVENRAHALKGLSGNIGLNDVFEPSKKMVDDVRKGYYADLRDCLSKVELAYKKARYVSEKLD